MLIKQKDNGVVRVRNECQLIFCILFIFRLNQSQFAKHQVGLMNKGLGRIK